MINIKSADLTSPTQKLIAAFMLVGSLFILWWILPPLITILANLYIAIGLAAGLAFLAYNYQNIWDLFKRLSWNWTKKMISSDKLWYLWQGYNYIVAQDEQLHEDIQKSSGLRIGLERQLSEIAGKGMAAARQSEVEKDPIEKNILLTKVKLYDDQFKLLEPKVKNAKSDEDALSDWYRVRVGDTQILKVKLDGKAQEYKMLKELSQIAQNSSKWMKESTEIKKFNESLIQMDDSIDQYTANIEDFRRNVLPKLNSGSSERIINAQDGAALIEQYKKQRLQLTV